MEWLASVIFIVIISLAISRRTQISASTRRLICFLDGHDWLEGDIESDGRTFRICARCSRREYD